MRIKIIIVSAIVIVLLLAGCTAAFSEELPINAWLFSPNSMASSFNSSINNYYQEFTGESAYLTTVNSDLYLWKDYLNSDDEKVVYANTFKTFTITFYCKNEFSYAEKVVIYADTSSLNKWSNLPIIMYAALIDDISNYHFGYSSNLYNWVHDGKHYSPYYANTFTTKYSTVGFKHTIEMTATTHLTFQCNAKEPTDTQSGWGVYWGCLSCDRIFGDPDGLYQISAPIFIPPLNELSVLRLPDNLEIIEVEALSGLDCEAIIIPEGCTTIGEKAFSECVNLLYVKIPSSVTSIASDAFQGCVKATLFIDVLE